MPYAVDASASNVIMAKSVVVTTVQRGHRYVSYAFSLKSPQALGHKTVVVSGLLTSAKKNKELKEPTLHVSEKDSKRT